MCAYQFTPPLRFPTRLAVGAYDPPTTRAVWQVKLFYTIFLLPFPPLQYKRRFLTQTTNPRFGADNITQVALGLV